MEEKRHDMFNICTVRIEGLITRLELKRYVKEKKSSLTISVKFFFHLHSSIKTLISYIWFLIHTLDTNSTIIATPRFATLTACLYKNFLNNATKKMYGNDWLIIFIIIIIIKQVTYIYEKCCIYLNTNRHFSICYGVGKT